MELQQLIKACKRNDKRAQSQLFQKYKEVLYFTSLKYSRNAEEAEDNLHDAFMVIFQKIKSFKNKGSFEGWMKRIVMFKAIDKYKKNHYVPTDILEDVVADTATTDTAVDHLSLDILLQCVQELPDQYRLVFNMYQLDGYTHKEVAGLLNISEGTSKSNYHRAKQLLQKKITELQAYKTSHHGA